MNTLKLLSSDFLMKESDIKTFTLQLLNKKKPYQIPDGATVRILIADEEHLLISKLTTIEDATNGIVSFVINENLDDGLFDCEIVVSDGQDLHETFPEEDFQSFRIVANLEERPLVGIEEIEQDGYKILITRLDNLEVKLENHTHEEFATKEQLEMKAETSIVDVLAKDLIELGNEFNEHDHDEYITLEELMNAISGKANIEDVHTKEELIIESFSETEVLAMFNAMFDE